MVLVGLKTALIPRGAQTFSRLSLSWQTYRIGRVPLALLRCIPGGVIIRVVMGCAGCEEAYVN